MAADAVSIYARAYDDDTRAYTPTPRHMLPIFLRYKRI